MEVTGHSKELKMFRRSHPLVLAGSFAALMLSGAAVAQSLPRTSLPSATSAGMPTLSPLPTMTFNRTTYSNTMQIGPAQITPPSDEDGQRLIVDVNTVPVDINLFVGATRIASKQAVNFAPGGTTSPVFQFDQAPVDINVWQGPNRIAAKEAVNLPGLPQ
jgi:hypothetical protein